MAVAATVVVDSQVGATAGVVATVAVVDLAVAVVVAEAIMAGVELARIILSQCVDQLAVLLAKVRAQEPYLYAHQRSLL